ncbi:hypothetical protein V6N11_033399 [Hibiscus sabdariffa]|uniref:AAA+ ATPase domain-containing protein n=1 Tax=Hibiscus sabdariffa TaxID=183260 RepID=A0ABR2PXY0_9ROSI
MVEPTNNMVLEWDNLVGVQEIKACLEEWLLMPLLNPTIFGNTTSVGRTILLFGPSGCGKSAIAKAISCEEQIICFSIKPCLLGDKDFIPTLFQVAKELKPPVILLENIDCVLSKKEIRQQLLLEMSSIQSDKVILLATTNKPQVLDLDMINQFTKRLYISVSMISQEFKFCGMQWQLLE